MSGTAVASRSPVRDYRDLDVWKRSIGLAKAVYVVAGSLPGLELYGLAAQLRRAAVSVPTNIAEGYGRQSTGDYRRHLSIARGSLMELDTQLVLSAELGYLPAASLTELHEDLRVIAKMLSSLISKLR